jgi:hypothetical protein
VVGLKVVVVVVSAGVEVVVVRAGVVVVVGVVVQELDGDKLGEDDDGLDIGDEAGGDGEGKMKEMIGVRKDVDGGGVVEDTKTSILEDQKTQIREPL